MMPCLKCYKEMDYQERNGTWFCRDHGKWPFNTPGSDQARNKVNLAINRGELKHLKKEHIECVDCGRRAEVYDHRDYNRPLMVEPVCKKCNSARGGAITTCSFGRLP